MNRMEMKTMKLWRKSRFCESLANSFANGRMRATYVYIIVSCAAFSLASCSSDDTMEWRLTNDQKETYGQNISGEYPGQYVIIYKDKDCKESIDEEGRHVTEAHEETFDGMRLDLSDYKMQHVFFQDFPISLIAKVVDADEGLSHALAEASPMAITARYDLGYATDHEHITWAFTPNVMTLHLSYGGGEHHIRIEFNNNSQYYISSADELKQPKSFMTLAKTGVALQLKAIYDGSQLIQCFGSAEGNFMHIMFKAESY